MLEFFFIERVGYYELLQGAYWLLITIKIKNKQTNKPAYQRPTPVLFLLQLLLLVEFSFRRTPDRRLIGD